LSEFLKSSVAAVLLRSLRAAATLQLSLFRSLSFFLSLHLI
jgi:hypothetical protein